jgi:phosphatidylglycerophosphate synthase
MLGIRSHFKTSREAYVSVSATPAAPRFTWRASNIHEALQSRRASSLDLTLAALTLARLSLVPVIIFSFMRVPALTTGAINLVVAAAVFDGVFARNRDADGPSRRALDSTVDRIGIDAGIVGAYLAGILPAFLLVALLARDAYCALICARMMYRRRVAIKADWVYRALNSSVALGAIGAPFLPQPLWVSLAGLMLLLSVAVAVDLTRSVRLVEGSSRDLRDTVLSATTLRRGAVQ